jgi:hypothetical protein
MRAGLLHIKKLYCREVLCEARIQKRTLVYVNLANPQYLSILTPMRKERAHKVVTFERYQGACISRHRVHARVTELARF